MYAEGLIPWLDGARRRLRACPLIRSERGAVAVEFAMVALPFLFIVFSIFELALVLLIFSTLENGVADAARTIRTGTFQNGSTPTVSTFTTAVCNNMGWLQTDCQSKLTVDVRTLNQFSNPNLTDPYSGGSLNSNQVTFSTGSSGSIVVVRAWYPWSLILPTMNASLSRNNNGIALIQATTTFKNEPY